MARCLTLAGAATLPLATGAQSPPSTPPSAPAPASAPTGWSVPRTAWGDPDLTGAWPVDHLAHTPRQRPQAMGTRTELTDADMPSCWAWRSVRSTGANRRRAGILGLGHWIKRGLPLHRTSLIVEPADGRYPALTAEGQRRAAAEKTSWNIDVFDRADDFGSFDRCITRGMPSSMLPGNDNSGVEIHQAPGLLAIRLEMIHETRLVHLDGRAPPPPGVASWLGLSVGRWEGDALVIETANCLPGASHRPAPNSAQLRVTERLTPTGPDPIRYGAWIEDPVALTQPYKLAFPWRRQADYEQAKYACHEGNHAIRDYITATATRFAGRRARLGAGE